MLKLERDNRTQQVNIRANRGETRFTTLFITALICASLLHAVFFLTFRIRKDRENYPSFILPPITVQTSNETSEPYEDFSFTENVASEIAKNSLYEPPPLNLSLPSIGTTVNDAFFYTDVQSDSLPLLSAIDKEFLLTELFSIDISIPVPYISGIHLSGPLAEVPYEIPAIPITQEDKVLSVKQIHPKRYIFDIIVDGVSGKVIWYDKHVSYPREIKEIILGLQFRSNQDLLVTKGVIEIITSYDKKGKYD